MLLGSYRAWGMWLIPALFFAYQFVLRLWPSLIMEPVMQQFGIGAAGYGLLASAYYFGYAGMQIPVAWACSRWGVRATLSVCACLCGLGTWLFTYTAYWPLALFARFLVGVGSAAGFLSVSQIVGEWFPKHRYAWMIGFSFTLGLSGAIFGGKPTGMWVQAAGYEAVAGALGAIAIAMGVLAWWLVRSPLTSEAAAPPFGWKEFALLLKRQDMWLLAAANLLMVGTLEGFADAWGIPFLVQANHWPKEDAAWLISFIFLGMMCGGPVLAACAEKWGQYPVIVGSGVCMGLLFVPILAVPSHQAASLAVLLFALGILSCYQVIIFAVGAEKVPTALLGVTTAFLNCANMMGGSVFHNAIGQAIEYYTYQAGSETIVHPGHNLPIYPLEAYQWALLVVPVSAILGSLCIVYLARRHDRKPFE